MDKRLRWFGCVTALFLLTHAMLAHAAFFQLAENSPAGLGNAFAGGAAIAEDASTVWYNPAGLIRLSRAEHLIGGHIIVLSTKAQGARASTATFPLSASNTIGGSAGGDVGESAAIPNFYYSYRLNDRTVAGFGATVPFGVATEYQDNWVGRYHAIRSEIETVNLNPAIGYVVNDRLSVGGGVNVQYVDATLTQAVDFGKICAAAGAGGLCGPAAGNDGHASTTADDTSYGYNLGLLWSLRPDTRLGFAYRSKIDHKLEGSVDMTAPSNVPASIITAGGFVDSGAMAYVTLPETLSVSVFHRMSPAWDIMGDIARTRWSRLPELRIGFDSAQPDSVVTLGLKDVNRYSVGANYRPGGAWSYRLGVALDRTPTPDETARTPRLPDEDRIWFAMGAGYRRSAELSFDVSFVHIEFGDASVNKTALPGDENQYRGNLVANYEATANILSAQARWALK